MGARIPIKISNFVMSNYNSLGYLRYQLMIYLVFSNTRSYGPLCGPTSSSCSLAAGLWPSARGIFCPLGKKRLFYAVLANFRPFLVSSSNLGLLEITLVN